MRGVLIHDFSYVFVSNLIFTCTRWIDFSVNRFLFDRSVKQLEYISKNSWRIAPVKLFNHKNIFLLWVCICVSKDSSKWPGRKLIGHLVAIFLINNRKNLPNEIRVCIVGMKN